MLKMFKKGFIFPALQYPQYESGFAVSITAGMRKYPDLRFELTKFRNGIRQEIITRPVPAEPALYCRFWINELIDDPDKNDADLYCLRFISPSNPDVILPDTDLEGQILLRHNNNAISSILTGFIPLRSPDYRYAPIIHTSHCMADFKTVETINLFMNIKNIEEKNSKSGGVFTAEIYSRNGNFLGKKDYPVTANSTIAISHDDIARDCNIPDDILEQGLNIKFYGGESQFSIITLFRHRLNGSIAIEHSLAPLYYIPALRNPEIRKIIYGQLEGSK